MGTEHRERTCNPFFKILNSVLFALKIEYSGHNFVYEMSTLCQDSDLIANYVLVHHGMHTLVILLKYGDYSKLWKE